MENWLISALIALFLFGLWGFFPKIAVSYINPMSTIIYGVLGNVIVGIFCLMYLRHPDTNPKGIFFAILTGFCGLLGSLFYYYAAKKGNLSMVVTITALYPLITILLSVSILKEALSLKQIAGMILAFLAIIMMVS